MPRKFDRGDHQWRRHGARKISEQDLGFELFVVAKTALEMGLDGARPSEAPEDDLRAAVKKAVNASILHLGRRLPPSEWPENHKAMIENAVVNATQYLDQVGEIGMDQPPMNWSEMNEAIQPLEMPEGMAEQLPGFNDNPQYVNSPRFPGAQGWN